MGNYQYNGPRYSDGPFCMVRVMRDSDGKLQTFTDVSLNGTAYVYPASSFVNMLGGGLMPTWRVRR